jgi:23S rRNA pseudouridine2605 synthase
LNGQVLTTPAVKVGKDDILTVNGQVVGDAEATRLWRYHKPVGLVTTHADPKGRPTVFDNLPPGLPRVISIGRLDLASEGLLLLTNDGGLARSLELPATGLIRRYRARAYGQVDQAKLDGLAAGAVVEGVVYGPIEARLDKVRRGPDKDVKAPANLWITVTLAEGKNREVRRVLESIGLKVNRLIRLAYGPFALGDLAQGAAEEVGPRVIRELLSDYINPLNLPRGDRTGALLKPLHPGGLERQGRRGGAAARPLSADGAGAATSDVKPPRMVYKAGWAKPKTRIAAHAKAGDGPPGGGRSTTKRKARPQAKPAAASEETPSPKGLGTVRARRDAGGAVNSQSRRAPGRSGSMSRPRPPRWAEPALAEDGDGMASASGAKRPSASQAAAGRTRSNTPKRRPKPGVDDPKGRR